MQIGQAAPAQSSSKIPKELRHLSLHWGKAACTSAYWENWHNGFVWNRGWREIRSTRFERANAALPFQKSAATFTTSFEVSAACDRAGGDVIFVAGIQDDDDVVIERWVLPTRLHPSR